MRSRPSIAMAHPGLHATLAATRQFFNIVQADPGSRLYIGTPATMKWTNTLFYAVQSAVQVRATKPGLNTLS